jgi:uncharacterized membrane protein
MLVIILSFLLLCAIGRSIIYSSKELIVLQAIMILIVLVGWKYSKSFFNGSGSYRMSLLKMSKSIMMIFVVGGSGFAGVEMVTLVVFTGGLLFLVSS